MSITDVTMFLQSMLQSIDEGDGTVQVCATLLAMEDTERDFVITLATSEDTGMCVHDYMSAHLIHGFLFIPALANFDYTHILSNLSFNSGSINGSTECLIISVIDDSALEGEQTFFVMLNSSDSDVILGRSTTTVIITDNDGKSDITAHEN